MFSKTIKWDELIYAAKSNTIRSHQIYRFGSPTQLLKQMMKLNAQLTMDPFPFLRDSGFCFWALNL